MAMVMAMATKPSVEHGSDVDANAVQLISGLGTGPRISPPRSKVPRF